MGKGNQWSPSKVNIVKLKNVVHILSCEEVKEMKMSQLSINHSELPMKQEPKCNPLTHPKWVTLWNFEDCQKFYKCSFKFNRGAVLIIKLQQVISIYLSKNTARKHAISSHLHMLDVLWIKCP